MEITTIWMKQNFSFYNRKYFKNKLPNNVEFIISRTTRQLGRYTYIYNKYTNYVFSRQISISNKFNLTESKFIDILLHEMIHCYIEYNNIIDNNTHGYRFRQIMNEINCKGNHNIEVTADGKETINFQKMEESTIVLLKLKHNNINYIAIKIPKNKMEIAYNTFKDTTQFGDTVEYIRVFKTMNKICLNWRKFQFGSIIHYRNINEETKDSIIKTITQEFKYY